LGKKKIIITKKIKYFLLIQVLILVFSLCLGIIFANFNEMFLEKHIRQNQNLISKSSMTTIRVDQEGVPYVNYGVKDGLSIKEQRNPITTANYALKYYDEIFQGNLTSLKYFNNCVKWLINNSIEDNESIFWEYNFDYRYNMTKPWRSGMAQGKILEVFIKSHQLSNDEKYLIISKKIIHSFKVPVKEGGVTYFENNSIWFEEYADYGGIKSKALNGMIFTLISLNKYNDYIPDEETSELFEIGVKSVISQIDRYDTKYWTYYDQIETKAQRKYHNIHINQMKILYNITNKPIFKEKYIKWTEYQKSYLRFFFGDRLSKLILLINVFLIFAFSEIIFYGGYYVYKKKIKSASH
jgi:heparosan-N-sulfate-glucuronate 5-epimerase